MITGTHLDHQALAALAAGEAPGDEAAAHLAICPHCRAELDHLVGVLTRLSQLAARHGPDPIRPLRLPADPAPSARRLRPAFVGLAAVAAVAAGLLLTFVRNPAPQPEIGRDSAFMEEIRALSEDSLPVFYQELMPDTEASSETTPSKGIPNPDSTSGLTSKGRTA